MFLIISILWPIFLLLVLGAVAKASGFLSARFWDEAEKGIYYGLFPALLIHRLWQADLQGINLTQIGSIAFVVVGLMSLAMWAFKPWLKVSVPAFTSFFQGGVRFNTYIGLAITSLMFDAQQVAITAVVVACMVPLINVACVVTFALTADARFSFAAFFKQLWQNPLIMGCVIGLLLNVLAIPPFAAVTDVLGLLAQCALPLGLLAVGAGLQFERRPEGEGINLWAMSLVVVLKLLILPLAFALVFKWLGVDERLMTAFVLFIALPTASSAYILARKLGGDAAAMAQIIMVQTLCAFLSLPLVLLWF